MTKFELSSAKDTSGGSAFDIFHSLKGVLAAYIISVILLFISAVLITYSPMPDSATRIVVIVITIFSILAAGFMVSRNSRRQGWLNGAVTGLFYTVLLYMVGSLITLDFSIRWSTVIMVGMGFLFGAIGGIVGINMGYKKRRQ